MFASRSLVPACLALVCYYLLALSVVYRPHDRASRLLLLPVALGFVAQAAFNLEAPPPAERVHGFAFMLTILVLGMRGVELAVSPPSLPLAKTHRVASSARDASPVPEPPGPKPSPLLAADLATNLRGIDWPFSSGLVLPRETRSPKTAPFLLHTLALLAFQLATFDIIQNAMRHLYPTLSSPSGGSLFDPSLHPLARYARSAFLTTYVGVCAYLAISATYLTGTLLGVSLLRQTPARWPPLFDAPWRATSLADFWGRRWHQLFRRTFVVLGAKPAGSAVARVAGPGAGRAAGVIAAFGVSGVFHDVATWGMGCGLETRAIVGFFVVNAGGVLLEEAWRRSGRSVGGLAGWVWTAGWVVGSAHMLVEAWLTRGLAGVQGFPDDWSVGHALVRLL